MNKIELLAPAGDINRAKLAFGFGADAVYFGGKAYSLRARASNFDFEQIKELTDYAHNLNRKVYIVTNIICHNHMLTGFTKFLNNLMKCNPDVLLCSDPYIIQTVKNLYPQVKIHISTQQSVTNSKAALFWQRNGASRIVTAREVSLNELKPMIKNVNHKIEIEIFGHGAVCVAYSGRCMLSSNYCLRDANNGGCAQSCRWVSTLSDGIKQYSDKFSMSTKDMCLINYVKEMMDSGIASMKIEGRMKSEHYIATVVNAYRKTIDAIVENKELTNEYTKDVLNAANRDVSIGWFLGEPSTNEMLYHDIPKQVNQLFVLTIKEKIDNKTYKVVSRNYFTIDDVFEVLSSIQNHIIDIKIIDIKNSNNESIKVVNTPMSNLIITFDRDIDLKYNDILRKKP
jgi:putative protease